MSQQCKEDVREAGMWPKYHQCKRKAWKDGYCKQHHPDSVAERRRKSAENFRAKSGAAIKANLKKQIAEQEVLIKRLQDMLDGAKKRHEEDGKRIAELEHHLAMLSVSHPHLVPKKLLIGKPDTDQSTDSNSTDCGVSDD